MARSSSLPPVELAWVGTDGHIYVGDAFGQDATRLSWSPDDFSLGWGSSKGKEASPTEARQRFSHPTWSPDGERVACFASQPLGEGEEQATPHRGGQVYVMDLRGIQVWDVLRLPEGSLVYMSFAPDGLSLLVLRQEGDQLILSLVSVDEPGEPVDLTRGAPLFASPAPGPHFRLALHTDGDSREAHPARVTLLPGPLAADRLISGRPGYFCTPAWSPDGTLLAFGEAAGPGEDQVVVVEPKSGKRRLLGWYRGMGAMRFSPSGSRLAVAEAPGGGGAPYQKLTVVDARTGEVLHRLDDHFLGFDWKSDEELVYGGVDMWSSCLWWYSLSVVTGARRQHGGFFPSREQLFALNFFDQYVLSHPFLDPSKTRVLFAGLPAGDAGRENDGISRVFVQLLEEGARATAVAEGVFASWRPYQPNRA